MSSISTTISEAYTYTHARKIASKVASDLLRFRDFYGRPSVVEIDEYEAELVELLKHDAINHITYGFKKNGEWVVAVKYHAVDGALISDDVPGRLRAGANVSGASFTSFLSYSNSWCNRPDADKDRIRKLLPFRRSTGEEPGVKDGYWSQDLNYVAGSRGLSRSSIRQW